MTTNQTNNNQSACEQSEDSLPRCLALTFPDELKNSCLIASLNGYANSIKLDDAKEWGNCASFTVNGNPAFMMRGYRGYISMVIEDGEAIFLGDIQFWSENAIFNSTEDLPSPYECLMAFCLNIEMINAEIPVEGADQALNKLFLLLQGTRLDGFLPKPKLADITPKIEKLVVNKFLEFNLIFADYDFSLDYAGPFMTGSINDHTFEITCAFNGQAIRLNVNVTSDYHLNLSVN